MSTPNFRTQKDFPLLVGYYADERNEDEIKQEIADMHDKDIEDVDDYDIQNYHETNSYWYYQDLEENFKYSLKAKLEKRDLNFFKIELESGYYDGVQMLVSHETYYGGCEYNPYDMDNEDTNDIFGLCRSVAIRKYDSEKKYVNKIMREIAEEIGMIELVCGGIFSNGEAIYYKADTLKGKLSQVA